MNVGDVMSDTTTLIAALENAPGVIIPLIREAPPQFLKRRPSPTKWSAHEHACHLSASDGPFLARLDLMLSAPAPFIRSILALALRIIPLYGDFERADIHNQLGRSHLINTNEAGKGSVLNTVCPFMRWLLGILIHHFVGSVDKGHKKGKVLSRI